MTFGLTQKNKEQRLPSGILPSIEVMIGAILAMGMDKQVLAQMCEFFEKVG
jgi:hypothetical protein